MCYTSSAMSYHSEDIIYWTYRVCDWVPLPCSERIDLSGRVGSTALYRRVLRIPAMRHHHGQVWQWLSIDLSSYSFLWHASIRYNRYYLYANFMSWDSLCCACDLDDLRGPHWGTDSSLSWSPNFMFNQEYKSLCAPGCLRTHSWVRYIDSVVWIFTCTCKKKQKRVSVESGPGYG